MVTLLLLSGCTLSPEYHKPDARIPLAWNQQDIALNTKDSPVSVGSFFSDGKLQQLIKLTIDNNKDLQISALNLQKAGVQYGVEKLTYLPNISLSAKKTAAHEPAGIFNTIDTGAVTYRQYDVKLVSASWEVDFWGRLNSLKEASLSQYLSANASLRSLKISLVEQTVSAYLNYLAARQYADIASQRLKNSLRLQHMRHQAFQAGELNQNSVIDADKDVNNAQADLAQIQLQAQQNYNALELLVGAPLPPSLFDNVTLEQQWRFPILQSGLPSQVLLNRPDIIAAEYQLKAANASIGAARAAFFPSISISAQGGSSTADMAKLLSSGTLGWGFVPSINLPIFDGGKNKANLNLAEINKKIEVINYQKAIQQAFRDVSDALAGQASIEKQSEQMSRLYDASLQQHEMARLSYAAGQTSKENTLQKNNELLSIRKQMLSMRLKYLTQGVKLFAVLGGDNSI
ncbi:efflux transporter outer membrane subunit [Enterobacteriaceae bacterium H18W14]|uniref:efflux transporter outer membrane subunit n=1 Tax=Dryocola boscaweniae TaxID=2925397 RepID=UPI0022F01E00|nr:efflux transporter outer membrane subunit [Dryocola boscaweniae]MCT4715469.1 efflux transporter outer membrane subunit [Dryocola boscaweniae]